MLLGSLGYRCLSICMLFMLSMAVYAGAPLASHAAKADQALLKLANEYLDKVYFPGNPVEATSAGMHAYDDKMKDYSSTGIKRYLAALKQYESRLSAIDPKTLSEQVQGDRDLVLNQIRSERLTLENIRSWEKDPDLYSSGATNAVFVIMERNFAPINDRLRALIAREKQIPVLLQQGKNNLRHPPKVYVEIALEQLPGLIAFFQQDLPAAFKHVSDPSLKKQFVAANKTVIQALQAYQIWLKNDLLPRADGDFRIGAQTFSKKLMYDEMVDLPLDKLLAIGMADMQRNQAEFVRVAHDIDPNRTPMQVLAELQANHPQPSALLNDFRGTFTSLINFIQKKKIITIPSKVRPILEETPPFMRATTFASMDTPGPFESKAKEAYFNVTLPDPAWSQTERNEYMKAFNYPSIIGTSIHEAYPGHYVQFLWMQTIHDRIRQLFGANTNAEGWAHYCEQMILDEGYGQGDGSAKARHYANLLRLAQLNDALLRNARYIVGIKMHTGQMSIDQAIDFFVKEGHQPRIVSVMEVKRGTADPTYLYYTLGKLEILKLRADLQVKEGSAFNLEQFHNDFMRQGFPPIKIVRKALLHDDSPVL